MSHKSNETHNNIVNHIITETHNNIVNHIINETQNLIVNQPRNENHIPFVNYIACWKLGVSVSVVFSDNVVIADMSLAD